MGFLQDFLRDPKTKFWKKKSCKITWGGLITSGIFENVFCIICIRFGQILEMENVLQTWRWYLMFDQITKIKKAGKKPWLDQRNDKILKTEISSTNAKIIPQSRLLHVLDGFDKFSLNTWCAFRKHINQAENKLIAFVFSQASSNR